MQNPLLPPPTTSPDAGVWDSRGGFFGDPPYTTQYPKDCEVD